ncbi:hypothetical protein ONZ51_g6541 [Trametes cubensis]|uniref:Carbohydrate-binding module family 13 protein n=1 Tax=Trametes cubensis TaxID=1111947 RepID=A0AAD7TRY9_9APHY|nr:hypothetical protein ONZ51_g6541 [Trametes cubensis]
MTFSKDGIYHIEHAHVAVRIALAEGKSEAYAFSGLTENGTAIIGFQKVKPGDNQKWIIKKESSATGYWKIQNKATFVDLLNGGSSNGTKIVGWEGSWDDSTSLGHQHWTFSPQSLPGHEIHTILKANTYLRQDFKSYETDGMRVGLPVSTTLPSHDYYRYLILSRARLQEIWNKSGLSSRKWREEIFDCDDFSFVYKSEVAKWGDNHFKADGFAIICGIMFGTNSNAAHAYNWMIDPADHSDIIFFE